MDLGRPLSEMAGQALRPVADKSFESAARARAPAPPFRTQAKSEGTELSLSRSCGKEALPVRCLRAGSGMAGRALRPLGAAAQLGTAAGACAQIG